MQYNFDLQPDRRSTESIKWNLYEPDVLPLWVADMDFPSPEPVIQALRQRTEHGIFGYPGNGNELIQAIVDWLARRHNWQVQPQDIVLLPDVMVGVHLAIHALTRPGESLLVQPPVYRPIYESADCTGRQRQEALLVQEQDGTYSLDFDAFEAAITPSTRLFLLCNPHNPVGRVFSRDELERLAEICQRHDVLICSDEIHADLIYGGQPHTPMASLNPEIARRTLTMMAPSKTFNIAGLKCSFAIIQDPELRKKFRDARQGLVGGVNVLALSAATAAYTGGQAWLEQLLEYLQGNRDVLYRFVREQLPGIRMGLPEGTYLAWLDCRRSGIPGNPAKFFLEHARVAFNNGGEFGTGGEGFIRLNFGCPRPVLVEALEKMRTALQREVWSQQAGVQPSQWGM